MIENILLPYVSARFATEEAYRAGHVRIVNPLADVVVLGLHIPDMKKIAKELAAREDPAGLIDGFEAAAGSGVAGGLYYEETVIWGLMLDFVKLPLDERLARFAKFIPHMDNWAVCDTVCGAAKWALKKDPARGRSVSAEDTRCRLWEFLDRWWSSDREFEVRFALIMSMCYFLDGTWLEKVFRKLETLDFSRIRSEYMPLKEKRKAVQTALSGRGEPRDVVASLLDDEAADADVPDQESFLVRRGSGYSLAGLKSGTVLGESPYYVRMGAAWLLATSLAKFPDRTRSFARSCALPEDVLKLYVRKSRESFRTREVSPF